MKATGKVEEVAKKAKSWKIVVGKKNYYCVNDVSQFVGRNIEFEYNDSEPYDFNGKMITSKYMLFDSIHILGGELPESSIITAKKPVSAPNSGIVDNSANPDWIGKERRAIRGMACSYAKDMVCQGKIEVSELENMATSIVNFIYEVPKEIPF